MCGMGKRLLHYLILAAVLLGVPAVCAWIGGSGEIWEGVKSFPPRTEDWGFHPEKLWNHRCPFSWPCFFGLVLLTFLCLRPFLVRAVRVMLRPAPAPARPSAPPPCPPASPRVRAFALPAAQPRRRPGPRPRGGDVPRETWQ